VNGYKLMTQALSPRLEDAKLALASAGWMPAREAAYLAMEARIEDFTREALDRLVLVERSFLELSTVRGQSYLVSREMAPAAIRSPCPALKEAAERDLAIADADQIDRLDMRERVIETLAQGPMTVKDLTVWFSRAEGRVARLLSDASIVGAVLTLLRLEGSAVRTNPLRSLDRGPSMYVTTGSLLEGEDPSQLEPLDALRTLCAYYFRVQGPATRADFGWWSGAGRAEVADALAAHRRNLVEVEIEGLPFKYFMPAARADELVQFERTGAEPVLLTPFRDPWLASHEGKAGRLVRTADLDRIAPGPAPPAVLIGGMLAGRWWLDTKDFEVRFEWFRRPAEGVEERAERRGLEIAAFAKREMDTLEPLAVPGPDGDVPVYV
jgi:hypothetical protein